MPPVRLAPRVVLARYRATTGPLWPPCALLSTYPGGTCDHRGGQEADRDGDRWRDRPRCRVRGRHFSVIHLRDRHCFSSGKIILFARAARDALTARGLPAFPSMVIMSVMTISCLASHLYMELGAVLRPCRASAQPCRHAVLQSSHATRQCLMSAVSPRSAAVQPCRHAVFQGSRAATPCFSTVVPPRRASALPCRLTVW